MEYEIKCFHCKEKFYVERDDYVPMFNETKKLDWKNFLCPKCGMKNKFARFSKNSNLLLAV